MSEEYFDKFLNDVPDIDLSEPQESLPAWVDKRNSSYAAFMAIAMLKQAKYRYIQGHTKKSDYKNKGQYFISKADVAKKIGKNAQPIFRDSSYSTQLREYLDGVNDTLLKAKNKKIERKAHGLQHLSKVELKTKTRSASEELKLIKQTNCEDLYTKLLENIPLDVKRRLGLK